MYVKIFDRILDSSIWDEPDHVRIAWITILVLADADGIVRGTVTALARRANITPDQMTEALATLTAPDPRSTTPDDEGRRVQEIGQNLWYVTTHSRYKSMQDADTIREQTNERVRNYRKKHDVTHGNAPKRTVTHGNARVTHRNAPKRTVTAPDPLLATPDDDERKVQSVAQNSGHVTSLGQDMRVQDAGSFETQTNESARNYNESQNVTHGNARVTHRNAPKRHTDTYTDTDLDHNPPTPLEGESPSNGEAQVEAKKKVKPGKKPSPRHTDIEALFAYWQDQLNHARAQLPKPGSLTYRRMEEAIQTYGLDGAKGIVRGAVEDIKRWPDRARYDTLDILLREGNITRLMGMDPNDPANASRLSSGKPGSWAIPTVKAQPPEPKPLPPLTAPTLNWSAMLKRLAALYPEATRDWIAPLVYVGDRGEGIELHAGDEFTARWVSDNHSDRIHDLLFDMTGRHVPVRIVTADVT